MKVVNPEKFKYNKKLDNNDVKSCDFCDPKIHKKQECKSLQGKYWRAIVNLYPYMDGNLMIVPKRHIIRIDEINKEEWQELHQMITKSQKRLAEIFKTKSFNVGINIGKSAGSSIPHMHWQIMPRRKWIPNFANIVGDMYVITVTPEKLKKLIDGK